MAQMGTGTVYVDDGGWWIRIKELRFAADLFLLPKALS
jgi:hypothetical protein